VRARTRLAALARTQALTFTRERMATAYRALYDRTLLGARRAEEQIA
jgi:hypothetical protein